MRIVGVIDLKGGRAVHAAGGVRARYQPVPRAGGTPVDGDAATLARVYHDVFGLDTLYVADLDAIAGGTPRRDVTQDLAAVSGSLWLDAGVASVEDAQLALGTGASRVIVGLETLPDFDVLERIRAAVGPDRVILSLDLRDGHLICRSGSPIARESIEDVAVNAWRAGIETMVVLDLSRVGKGSGPGIGDIDRVRQAVPDAAVYAGGGIRSIGDVKALQAAGATGALIATALQNGSLTPADLHSILAQEIMP